MNITKRINRIIDLCELHNIEIVSYGLAPNPNGFCYEAENESCINACRKLDSLLDSLDDIEVVQLKYLIFGS